MKPTWVSQAERFVQSMSESQSGGFRSVPNGRVTLYGTCYGLLTRFYLGNDEPLLKRTRAFIQNSQDHITGLFVGPELLGFSPCPGILHDRHHLLLHLTCAALPVCQHFGLELRHPVRSAHAFCELDYLRDWLEHRDLKHAWFEGNNILFAGQLLVYLRDVELHPGAAAGLALWFDWLDNRVDPATGLWGTDGYCSELEAVYGGYHQLLVYYHEHHCIPNPSGIVDTVLSLKHEDGGFNPGGNAGACEDVDSVDVLVNLYKQFDYRRAEIRCALRQCLRHILNLQNSDGGFPYNRNCIQSHMGVPGTEGAPNQSTTFATWFRVHTLALIAEILTDEPQLQFPFRFTNNLSMGWHQTWEKSLHRLAPQGREAEMRIQRRWKVRRVWKSIKQHSGAAAKKVLFRTRTAIRSFRRIRTGE